jgi:hypothetical protein
VLTGLPAGSSSNYRAGWRSIYQRSLKVAKGGSARFRLQGKAKLVTELARKYGIIESQVLTHIATVSDAEGASK